MVEKGFALTPGQILAGKYRVQDRLAGGGYADVFLARRLEDSLPVAIKALRLDAEHADPAASDRFVREAAIAAHLKHPNLVHILDFGQSRDRVLYMVMEQLKGRPLSAVIHAKPMEPARVLQIMRQMLDALVLAHGQGTIHRDLKPSNVYLCRIETPWPTGAGDWVKILDFGFAKGIAQAGRAIRANLTLEGAIVGTPGYVAPELLQEGGLLTPLVDLYAVGILGYEMLTGTPAYAGEGLERASRQVIEDPPEPESIIAEHPIYTVVRRLIERNPHDRYQSAESALFDIKSADQSRGTLWM